MFTQLINPLGNLTLTCLVALIPVVFLLVLLAVFRVPAWLATLLGSIVTLLLGVMIWNRWPAGSLWVIGTLVGISIVMTGITRLMMALAFRKLLTEHGDSPAKNAAPHSRSLPIDGTAG